MRRRGVDNDAETADASSHQRLEAIGVSKAFGSLKALEDVELTVLAGEVHVLVGENGAGKSTLVSLLNGSQAPDAGTVQVDGQKVDEPSVALDAGVATVRQHLSLVPSMTGLENVALAIGASADTETRRLVDEQADRYGVQARLSERVEDTEMPARQRLALLRALCQHPRFLLLDEPTTFLPPTEIPQFLETLRSLAEDGLGVLLITHRVEEVRAAADRGTVLRQGRVVATFSSAEMPDRRKLAALIAGHEVRDVTPAERHGGEVNLEARGLEVQGNHGQPLVRGIGIEATAGSIVGLAGVDGNGQEPLLLALGGFLQSSGGRIVHGGVDITSWPARRRLAAGIRSVPSNRRDGIVPEMTITEHFQIAGLPYDRASVEGALESYGVRPADAGARADRLSGGNQQKLQLALAIEQGGDVLLLSYPTSGLDVEAQVRIHEILIEEARRGTAIILASGELDELFAICDRIVVLNRGRTVGEQVRGGFDAEQLVSWYIAKDYENQERV